MISTPAEDAVNSAWRGSFQKARQLWNATSKRSALLHALFFGGMLGAILLRISAIFTDFWLDEIWSLNIASNATSALDVLLRQPHDNNHHLNTLYLYLLGRQQNWALYRLLSLCSGTATVAFLGWISYRRDKVEGIIVVWLIGFSYLLILYSSEARGYAPALFFAAVGFRLAEKHLSDGGTRYRVLFWVCCLLGFLSHLTFIYFYLSVLVWSSLKLFKISSTRSDALIRLLRLHAVPTYLIVVIYYLHISRMIIGGGDTTNIAGVLNRTLALTFGLPRSGLMLLLSPVVGAVVILLVSIYLWREKMYDLLIFYAGVVLAAPALVLLLTRPVYLYERYFLISVFFLLLFMARFLTWCYRQGYVGRYTLTALLSLYCLGNGVRVISLLEDGRGQYFDAVRYMSAHTKGAEITVGSDHDFRNRVLLEFYASYLPPGKRLRYLEHQSYSEDAPEWFITHSLDVRFNPQSSLVGPHNIRYNLKENYPYSGDSGWQWSLYQRSPDGE